MASEQQKQLFKLIKAGTPGHLPMPKLLTAEQVRQQAQPLSETIFSKWGQLKDIVQRHEEKLHKRWMKRNIEQRRMLILTAWPSMARSHRPDFYAFHRETETQRENGTRYRDEYLMPFVNQEDLVQTRPLLLMFGSRGHNPPAEFAFADLEAWHLGVVSKAIVPAFSNGFTMMFTGRHDVDTYGELIAWEDNESAFDWLMNRKGVYPGEGLILLEVQQKLYDFLLKCARLLLQDIPDEQLTNDSIYPRHHEPLVMPQVRSNQDWPSLAVMTAEAPYQYPSKLDINRIVELLEAKVAYTEHHIWLLRDDPGYYEASILEIKDHRLETIKSAKGEVHPVFKPGNEKTFWGRLICSLVVEAYMTLEVWAELRDQAIALQDMLSGSAQNFSPEDDLPDELLNELLKFQNYLNQATKGVAGSLRNAAPSSPPLRRFFERTPNKSSDPTFIPFKLKTSLKLDEVEKYLLWLLWSVWEDSSQLFLAGLTNLNDEIERLVRHETKAKDLISAHIAAILGDLSVLCACLQQIELFQPWAASFENLRAGKEQEIRAEFKKQTEPCKVLLNSTTEIQEGLVLYGAPICKSFHYPAHKKRSKTNVEAMRLAEKNLDHFWSQVDSKFRKKSQSLKKSATWTMLLPPHRLHRTPPWVEESSNPYGPSRRRVDKLDTDASLGNIWSVHWRNQAENVKPSPPNVKKKIKTRGETSPATVSETSQTDPKNHFSQEKLFAVNDRALKVFRSLFFDPEASSTPGEIDWRDFCYAMQRMSFAIEELYGSVWKFTPTELDIETKILFHKPHPDGKIDFHKARRFGKRLHRSYGWTRASFAPLKKDCD